MTRMRSTHNHCAQLLLSAGMILLGLTFPGSLRAADPNEPSFKPPRAVQTVANELVIKYRASPVPFEVSEGARADILSNRAETFTKEATRLSAEFPVEVVATYPAVGVQRLHVGADDAPDLIKARLVLDDAVEFVEPNYWVYAFRDGEEPKPNDPTWPVLWGIEKIRGPEAWTETTGSEEVVVAVIDTGVDYAHRDLKASMWRNPKEEPNEKDDDGNGLVDDLHGINLCPGEPNGDPLDAQGHGTHVAGTIAATGNNERDVVGVAWQARILAVKFLCRDGGGTTADAIRGIEYALAKGAQILNMSWGGPGRSRALEAAIREAERQGVLVVAAAGNEGSDNDKFPQYPSSYQVPNVLAVAATAPEDQLAAFSNWGKKSVHLAAPGVSILSTVPGNRLTFFNGTSMASPHVTGCAALLKARTPSLAGTEVKAALLSAGDPVPGLDGRLSSGRRLNCGRAVLRQQNPAP